jgi:8-hydroxy-5-deazaflavin:NADPH oxidoreductase
MQYAIIGSGAIGSALASHFVRKHIPAQLANKSGAQSLESLAQKLGPEITWVCVAEALGADIVILAVPFGSVREVTVNARPWNGRIVVDATNAIDFPAFTPMNLGGRPSSEIVAEQVPGARVVKAFNTLPAALLATSPESNGGRRVLFLSGDDQDAKSQISRLAGLFGFAPIDLGALSDGGRLQQFGGPLIALNLVKMA